MTWPTAERPPLSDPFRNDFRAGIIEAEPINDRFIRNRPKDTRRRIARLRVPGDRPKFAKAEAQARPGRHCFGIFIHACRQSNWISKPQPKTRGRQVRRAEERFERIASQVTTTCPSQSAHGAPVNLLRVLSEKNGAY